ncbi:hypothetical protein K0M31_019337 [Melipona bicolor]|uniref:Uncharacterized protein n=1 Tax=Melipona bicolor TaxID=60889 RepID=A0AA40G273_9HYME|nr:hypothetical protein K0M31_019337 [Melipona bicolor]
MCSLSCHVHLIVLNENVSVNLMYRDAISENIIFEIVVQLTGFFAVPPSTRAKRKEGKEPPPTRVGSRRFDEERRANGGLEVAKGCKEPGRKSEGDRCRPPSPLQYFR